MRHRRPLLVTSLAAAGLVVSAVPAGAHPFVTDGAEAPANSLASITLAMAHGCGDEAGGEGDPTSDVSLEVPESFSYLEPGEVEGYEVSVEGDEGAVPDIVTWTATDGGVPAPEFPMDVVVDGAEGDELFLSVFQACDDFEYRWIGTPDEPADDPAIGLTLTAEDPDSPPPAVEEPAPTDDAPADDAAAGDAGTADDAVNDDAAADDAGPADDAAADGAADAAATDGEVADDATDAEADAADETPDAVEALPTEPEDAGDDDGSNPLPWIIAVALVLTGGGAFLGSRRKPVDPAAGGPGTPDDGPPAA